MTMSIPVMLFVLAQSAPDAAEQANAAPKSARENYKAFCLPCHGPDGKGARASRDRHD